MPRIFAIALFAVAIATSFACSSDTAPTPSACADGADNDNDGRVDFPDDTGCSEREDDSETNAPLNDIIGVNIQPQAGSTLQLGGTVSFSFSVACAGSYVVSIELIDAATGETLLPIGGLGCGTTVTNGSLGTTLVDFRFAPLQGKQVDSRILISTDASRTTVLLSRVIVTAFRT